MRTIKVTIKAGKRASPRLYPVDASVTALPRLAEKYRPIAVEDVCDMRPWPKWRRKKRATTNIQKWGTSAMASAALASTVMTIAEKVLKRT